MKWSAGCEASWLAMLDMVFVGTKYHAGLLLERERDAQAITDRGVAPIHVVGIPVAVSRGPEAVRERLVVFPHRLTPDKHPELFDYLALRVGEVHPDVKFVRTQDLKLSKPDYYDLLARAAVTVSFADQETFGISMVEAALLGSTPIAPKRLAYRETLDPKWLDRDMTEAFALTVRALDINRPHENQALGFYSPENVTARVSALLSTLTWS
jgi:glycosyltransferase involved in cell wall biosynthesis